MPTRSASAKWEGGLKGGKGNITGLVWESGRYNFGSRFADEKGTNPEELLAAAEAACFSMALSGGLEKNGTPPTSVDTTARCTIEKVGEAFAITRMQLEVRAVVPKIADAAFQQIVAATRDGCPVSKAIKGNVDIQVTATLSS